MSYTFIIYHEPEIIFPYGEFANFQVYHAGVSYVQYKESSCLVLSLINEKQTNKQIKNPNKHETKGVLPKKKSKLLWEKRMRENHFPLDHFWFLFPLNSH